MPMALDVQTISGPFLDAIRIESALPSEKANATAAEDKTFAQDPAFNAHEDIQNDSLSMREKRPLVKREGHSDLDIFRSGEELDLLDSYPIEKDINDISEKREIPMIPFDELMLIEALGMGRVSTIYRAAWRSTKPDQLPESSIIRMLALKVAMVNPETRDTSHVEEMRREADIAARLQHPNISDLVGIAADHEYVLFGKQSRADSK
jgi:hypothetical protein